METVQTQHMSFLWRHNQVGKQELYTTPGRNGICEKGLNKPPNLPSQGPIHCNSPLQPFKETKWALQKQFAHWSNRSEPLNLSQPSDSQKLRSFYNNQPTDLSARAENTLQHYANLSSLSLGRCSTVQSIRCNYWSYKLLLEMKEQNKTEAACQLGSRGTEWAVECDVSGLWVRVKLWYVHTYPASLGPLSHFPEPHWEWLR